MILHKKENIKKSKNTFKRRSLNITLTIVSTFIIVFSLFLIPYGFSQDVDLTNQDSPYAATYQDDSSFTMLNEQSIAISVEQIIDDISTPLMVVSSNDGSDRLFIVDQIGFVWVIDADGKRMSESFLDVRDRMVELNPSYDERGLLSLAFSPNYANDGKIYVHYSAPLREEAPSDWDHTVHISQFTVSDTDSNMIDPGSERIIMAVDKPQGNHNGGQVIFGADGYMYLTIGDGGNRDDEGTGHTESIGNAQDLTKVLGKTLRIDVSQINDESPPQDESYIVFTGNETTGTRSYEIPIDNPFVNNETTPPTFPIQGNIPPEIYAYGHRNPAYATTFSSTSSLVIEAEAGQELFEEVNLIVNGGNYGWRLREGTYCFDPDDPEVPPSDCDTTGYLDEPLIGPIFDGGHDLGVTVIGGTMYWGTSLPLLTGKYIFGYFALSFGGGSGIVLAATPPAGWSIDNMPANSQDLTPEDNEMWTTQQLEIVNAEETNANEFIRGISSDNNGEIYISMSSVLGPDSSETTGRVYRITQAQPMTDITLYGSGVEGWGFTEETMTTPGPQIEFLEGVQYNMTLIGTDGELHNFFVDYNGNGSPDTDEPTSPDFSQTINYQFTPDRTGEFTYYCLYHPTIMYGNASIIPEFSFFAVVVSLIVAATIVLVYRKRSYTKHPQK